MSKAARVDAFQEVTKAIKNNDLKRANDIFEIIVKSIEKDRKNNTFSEFIELKGKAQEKLFKNIIIKDD